MSVINKVLRDLDRRGAPRPEQLGAAEYVRPHPTVGAATTDSNVSGARSISWALVLVGVLVGGALSGGLVLLRDDADMVRTGGTPIDAVPREVGHTSGQAALATAGTPNSDPLPMGVTESGMRRNLPVPESFRMELQLRQIPRERVVSTPVPLSEPASDPRTARVATSAIPPINKPAMSGPAALPVAPKPRVADAAVETLAQAQALWGSGARAAAIDTLREALTIANRSEGESATGAATRLARELARMQLTEGQVTAAFETLSSVQRWTGGDAEWWALRGNAAQRLGRHGDAVSAYQTALRLRPGEVRWKLALAVSLAANGEIDAAADWAEQLAHEGALNADIANYLRQAGVPIRVR